MGDAAEPDDDVNNQLGRNNSKWGCGSVVRTLAAVAGTAVLLSFSAMMSPQHRGLRRESRKLNYVPDIGGEVTDYTHLMKNPPNLDAMVKVTDKLKRKSIGYQNISHRPALLHEAVEEWLENGELRRPPLRDIGERGKSYDWLQTEARPLDDLFDVIILTGNLTVGVDPGKKVRPNA